MSTHGLVTGALAVAVLGLGAYVVTRPAPMASPDGDADGLAERLDALEAKVDKSAESIRALKRAPRRTARATPPSPAPAESAAAGVAPALDTVRVAALEARLDQLEKRMASVAAKAGAAAALKPVDPSTLDNKQLFAKAMALNGNNKVRNNPNKDFLTEADYWEALLQRDITESQRDSALYNLGITYRSLKDHEKEAETFEALITHAGGMDTSRGAEAGFQLGWARWYQGDHTRSLDAMDKVANSSSVSPILQYHALFRAGESAMKLDDPGRARPYFQRVVDDHGDSIPEVQKWLLDRTKQYLTEIDKR